MFFLIVLVAIISTQSKMIDTEPLLQYNSNQNNNYDYFYDRLGTFKEDITDYDNADDQLNPVRFPSAEDYSTDEENLKTYFESPDNASNEDKRSIEEASNTNLVVRNTNEELSRKKKSQVLCRVRKNIHTREDNGYDYLPKKYMSYTCHQATPTDIIQASRKSSEHDFCYVSGNSCVEIEKEHWFAKRSRGKNNNCWVPFREAVAVGCHCLPQKIKF